MPPQGSKQRESVLAQNVQPFQEYLAQPWRGCPTFSAFDGRILETETTVTANGQKTGITTGNKSARAP